MLVMLFNTEAAAKSGIIPQDNDATYKLPTYVPKAAQPKRPKKVIFEDSNSNDALYSLPSYEVKELKTNKSTPAPKSKTPKPAPQPTAPQAPADVDNGYKLPQGQVPQYYYPPQQPQRQQVPPNYQYYQRYQYDDQYDDRSGEDAEYYPNYYYY